MLIIGITGTNGAGKGTVVDYLIKKGFKHFSVSDYLKQELQKRNLEMNRPNMQSVGNEIREKNGPDYITRMLFDEAKSKDQNSVIESIRNPKEAEFIKSHGGYLFAITADQQVRYDRIKARGSEKDSVTFEEFKKQEESESQGIDSNAQNLPKCISLSDFTITNNDSIEDLNAKIEEILRKI
jgi:dephospho-CoA kinase